MNAPEVGGVREFSKASSLDSKKSKKLAKFGWFTQRPMQQEALNNVYQENCAKKIQRERTKSNPNLHANQDPMAPGRSVHKLAVNYRPCVKNVPRTSFDDCFYTNRSFLAANSSLALDDKSKLMIKTHTGGPTLPKLINPEVSPADPFMAAEKSPDIRKSL